MKEFIQIYWRLIICEIFIVIIYVCFYTCSRGSNFEIIISPEILATLLVGIAAIYSWIHHKKISDSEIEDAHYDNNLQLLRNVDELLEVYKNKGEVREIGIEIQDFLISLEKQYIQKQEVLKPRDKFLDIYYRFINDKISTDQDSLESEEIDLKSQEKSSTIPSNSSGDLLNENDQESPIQYIKTKVSEEFDTPTKNIRYSKNYEDDAIKDNLNWTTWFTIGKNTIDKLGDKDKQIFITNVNGKDIRFQMQGKDLKDIISEGKPRKRRRAGKEVYDLFFGQDSKGNFVEGRHKIDLQKYNIEIL
ncbi:hypothetical protein [Streptococcus sanguinis]|uniref:hypothetical protein n=1 Tax=Streptococcus sanguinis TaxID=1305 RepID=UPI000F65CE2E|nr:hypothetical protein [Streptococcus sanguinis]